VGGGWPDPVKDGVLRWRCVDLQARIEEEFDVKLHVHTIENILPRMAFAACLCVKSILKLIAKRSRLLKKPLPAS
jgi:hypothetical protein